MDKLFPIEDQIEMLASALRGRVVAPHHADYDSIRTLVPGNYDHQPLAVVRVANAADVAAVLNFARATDLPVAVRSGGHSGFGGTNDGIVIDLRGLDMLAIDHQDRSVWAGAGLTAGAVTAAVEEHGLVVGFGDTASVGIGGLTLGGGIGYLVRKHGLTIDSVLAAEIVTAAGDILVVDATSHPDLFWAVRGGGGNFGVVTRWKYRLHDLPAFVGGPLVLPATPEVVAGFVAAAEAAPEQLSAIASIMPAPPLPFLAPELHGATVFFCMMAYAGELADADAALAPFRALATPHADLVGPAPYSSMYMAEESGERPSFSVRSRLMDHIGTDEAETIIDAIERSDAPMRLGEIRVLGGAFARIPSEATAFAHRASRVMVSLIALSSSPAEAERHDIWADKGIKALQQGPDRVYVNFMLEGTRRLGAAYPPATLKRLRAIKRQYDPDNLLRLNQNILPA